MLKIQIITHYCIEDIEFDEDYTSKDIVKINEEGKRELIISYGDSYHDSGHEKVEGFLNAMDYFKIEYEVEYINQADYNGC